MTVSSTDRRPATAPGVTALRGSVLALAGLVVLKFLAILADEDWDLARSPFFLLVVVAVPVALVVGLSLVRPRAAAVVAAPSFVLFVVVIGLALVRDGFVRESWADYPFAYGGIAVALWGLYAAGSLLRSR